MCVSEKTYCALFYAFLFLHNTNITGGENKVNTKSNWTYCAPIAFFIEFTYYFYADDDDDDKSYSFFFSWDMGDGGDDDSDNDEPKPLNKPSNHSCITIFYVGNQPTVKFFKLKVILIKKNDEE